MSEEFTRFISDSTLEFRRTLFPDDSSDLFRYTFQLERGPGYAWVVRQRQLILRLHDPGQLIPGTHGTLYEAVTDLEHEEYAGAVGELEQEFQDLQRAPTVNSSGRTQFGRAEFPRLDRSVAFEIPDLDDYGPTPFRDRLIAFIEAVDGYEFAAAQPYIRVLVSPVARMPGEFLDQHLTEESDTVIAFLRAHLPAENIVAFVDALPPERRAKVQHLSGAIQARDDFPAEVFRETERILERKFAATRGDGPPA